MQSKSDRPPARVSTLESWLGFLRWRGWTEEEALQQPDDKLFAEWTIYRLHADYGVPI